MENSVFNIADARLSFANLDMDFLVRFNRLGEKERVVSPRALKDELDQYGDHLFCKFYTRAYKSGKEVSVCKLRSGVRVEFVLR